MGYGSRVSTKPSTFSQRAHSIDRSGAKKFRTLDGRADAPIDGISSPKSKLNEVRKRILLKPNAPNRESLQ